MQQFSNNGSTTLAVAITDLSASLQVAGGTGDLFPDAVGDTVYFMITVEDVDGNYVIMQVDSRTGDLLNVTRAQEGTTAIAFDAGARVELRTTKGTLENFFQRDGDTIDGGTY